MPQQTYTVSRELQKRFDQLTAMPQVQEALRFLKEQHDASIQDQIELAMIEAPTFHEQKRARRFMNKLHEAGVQNLSMDEHFNVTGLIAGTEHASVLTEAHMDTVFPEGTVHELRREGTVLFAPGIYDNARGMTCLLYAVKALIHSGIRTRKNLIVAGTTREEADGALGGMKELIARYPDIDGSVSVDGGYMERLTFRATWNRVMRYTFKGIGGHAFSAFGMCANPLGAACRAVAKINEISVPASPKTTYAATKLESSQFSGITAIPDSATLYVNYRSDSQNAFKKLTDEIERCVEAGCAEENTRWNADTITVQREEVGYLPGGAQDEHSPIVEANYLAAVYAGYDVALRPSGNSNSNIPISQGIPAVTVGNSARNCHAHSTAERFDTADAYRCPQGLLLLLLMTLGVENGIPSCLAHRI